MSACVSCGEALAKDLDLAGHGVHPTCEPLELSADIVASELFALIGDALVNAPRSLQRRIGPSEMGIPCDRRIAYILARTPKVKDETVAWKPAIGTAVHELLAGIVAKANTAGLVENNAFRWHVEERVTVGAVWGVPITGSTDLFDAWSGTVFDWKVSTRNKIREEYRPHGPGEQYRAQAHLYGRGWAAKGFTVRNVAIVFFTRDGEWLDKHVWSEPYDESIALAALERANTIATDLADGMPMDAFATGDAYCNFCPWYRKNATQISVACPGHAPAQQETPSLGTLIGV